MKKYAQISIVIKADDIKEADMTIKKALKDAKIPTGKVEAQSGLIGGNLIK